MVLDNQQPISNKFNEKSLIDIEKRLRPIQFSQKQQENALNIQITHAEEIKKELNAFKNTKELKHRIQEKEKEIIARNNPVHNLDYIPKNMKTTLSWEEIKNEAESLVRLEHKGKIQDIHDRYIKDITPLIEQAEKRNTLSRDKNNPDLLKKRVIAHSVKRKQEREIKERLSRLPEKDKKVYHDKKNNLDQKYAQEETRRRETTDERITQKFDDLREKEHHQSKSSGEPKTQSEKQLLIQASNEVQKEDQAALKEIERENNKALLEYLDRAKREQMITKEFNEKSRGR